MPYTIEDADAFKAILTDPAGPWAKAPATLRNKAIADHDARVADLVARGELASPTAVDPQTEQQRLYTLREAEKHEFNSGALNQLTEPQVALLTARVDRLLREESPAGYDPKTGKPQTVLRDKSDAQLDAMVDKQIYEFSFLEEFENQRRQFQDDGSLKGPPERGEHDMSRIGDARPMYDRLSAEAAAYLKAHPEIKITIKQARADHAVLRSLAAASRVAKK
jgi:hypothetical protein